MPDGATVAVEVDGPGRLTSNFPHAELGKTRLKRRLLQDRGLKVVNVPYTKWDSLAGKHWEQEAYLRSLIDRRLGQGSTQF